MSNAIQAKDLTERQIKNLAFLKEHFGLSDGELNRCLFFSREQDEPWIPADVQIKIAQADPRFTASDPEFVSYIEPLKQFIYKAHVTDDRGRVFARVGVATVGERPGGYEIDPHDLAQSRALGKALTDAQFNPFKNGRSSAKTEPTHSGPPVRVDTLEWREIPTPAEIRKRNLNAIHAIAEQKGLIYRDATGQKNMQKYRNLLLKHYGVASAVLMTETQRESWIEFLRNFESDDQFIQDLPVEMRSEAAIA